MELKEIAKLKAVKWIYEVTFVDGTKGIMEIDPVTYIPIIDGKLCDKCYNAKNMRHCLYYKCHELDDECPEGVIKCLTD